MISRLRGKAVAADRMLHARRRILSAEHACGRAGDERGAASLPDGERGAGVGADERLLEHDCLRLVPLDELRDRVVDLLQAQLGTFPRRRLPPAELDRLEAAAASVDDSVSARCSTRVDSEDLHASRLRTGADVPPMRTLTPGCWP